MAESGTFNGDILKHEPYIHENYNLTYLFALPRNSRAVYLIYEVGEGARAQRGRPWTVRSCAAQMLSTSRPSRARRGGASRPQSRSFRPTRDASS